jgi:hypothetical protein
VTSSSTARRISSAERHARHARISIPSEATVFDRPGIGFERDFHVVHTAQACPNSLQEHPDVLGSEQAGGAAAEKNRYQRPVRNLS